ncbi:MAG: DNA-processing protein DprA [Phycisphaerales bacterium]|nr:DNA-processing protein DprA [Phycisphaerales bacterium]
MTDPDHAIPMLRLALTPGVGPVLGRRLIDAFGSAEEVLGASVVQLAQVRGIAQHTADKIARGIATTEALAREELGRALDGGTRVIGWGDPAYPELLAPIEDAPLVLWVRGMLDDASMRYRVAMVGSRRCTPYGVEQAERFASALAQAGLTIVSGGARGIDTAAHRSAVRVGGWTIVVSGCGLSRAYPPENAALFEEIVASGGAVVSELPMATPPTPENFPARNRIISGMSLGVVVIEAPQGSGALITAKQAGEAHGREVMAVPGRVDSSASVGSNQLIRDGAAALVTSASDVLEILREPARGQFAQSVAVPCRTPVARRVVVPSVPVASTPGVEAALGSLSAEQRRLWEALESPATMDELTRVTGLDAGRVLADATILEMKKLVSRQGSRLVRAR